MKAMENKSEERTNLLTLLNRSGFPFQKRIEHEVRSCEGKALWSFYASEYHWKDEQHGTEGYIDLVLNAFDIQKLVIECKKVKEGRWLFMISRTAKADATRARCLWTHRAEEPSGILRGWSDFLLNDPSYETDICIIRGQDDNMPMLERICNRLLLSMETFAVEETNRLQPSYHYPDLLILAPVIVTNARLEVGKVDFSKVSLSTGELEEAEFQEVPFIRFRKPLFGRNRTVGKTIKRALAESERTVFVMNSEYLHRMLGIWDFKMDPRKNTAPWDEAYEAQRSPVSRVP